MEAILGFVTVISMLLLIFIVIPNFIVGDKDKSDDDSTSG
jgi:hypothetical protein